MLSNRGKIVLIVVAVVLVVAIIVLYVLSRNKPVPITSEGTATPTGLSDSSQVPPGELPTAQSGGGGGGGAAIPAYDDEGGLPIGRVSPTPTPRTGLSKTPSVITGTAATTTPQPASKTQVIGDLDFTKDQGKQSNIVVDQTALEKIGPNPDPCTLSGIQNSWSNPFEKTICGIMQFFSNQIVGSLDRLNCEIWGSNFAVNYNKNIQAKYQNNQCYILDRK